MTPLSGGSPMGPLGPLESSPSSKNSEVGRDQSPVQGMGDKEEIQKKLEVSQKGELPALDLSSASAPLAGSNPSIAIFLAKLIR